MSKKDNHLGYLFVFVLLVIFSFSLTGCYITIDNYINFDKNDSISLEIQKTTRSNSAIEHSKNILKDHNSEIDYEIIFEDSKTIKFHFNNREELVNLIKQIDLKELNDNYYLKYIKYLVGKNYLSFEYNNNYLTDKWFFRSMSIAENKLFKVENIYDDADVLTIEQKEELQKEIDLLFSQTGIEVVIITKSQVFFARDFKSHFLNFVRGFNYKDPSKRLIALYHSTAVENSCYYDMSNFNFVMSNLISNDFTDNFYTDCNTNNFYEKALLSIKEFRNTLNDPEVSFVTKNTLNTVDIDIVYNLEKGISLVETDSTDKFEVVRENRYMFKVDNLLNNDNQVQLKFKNTFIQNLLFVFVGILILGLIFLIFVLIKNRNKFSFKSAKKEDSDFLKYQEQLERETVEDDHSTSISSDNKDDGAKLKLKTFVENSLSKGYEKEELREILLKNNINKSLIDEIFDEL